MPITRICQMLPTVERGDAVSEHALLLSRAFTRLGIANSIHAENIGSGLVEIQPVAILDKLASDSMLVIYHHSTGTDLVPVFLAKTGKRLGVFHNITPPENLTYAPSLGALAHRGLQQMEDLCAAGIPWIADSSFNAGQLKHGGAERVEVIPLAVSNERWSMLTAVAEARTQRAEPLAACFVYLGRIVPHKRVEDVIAVCEAYSRLYDPSARLRIAGGGEQTPDYFAYLQLLAAKRGVPNVEFCGRLDSAGVARLLEEGSFLVSMSVHEGFCVPLVEAMLAGVPVLARDAGGVGETLGNSGLLFASDDPLVFAEAAHYLQSNANARTQVVHAQQARSRAFSETEISRRWAEYLRDFQP